MSQALKSKASEEKEEEKTKRSIEEAQEWEEQINAAHNVHRIAMVSRGRETLLLRRA
jgi:hypothetical protein